MNIFWKAKRRLRNEMRGIKYLMNGKTTQRVIKVSKILYETSRVFYNPFYLLEIARRQLIKNMQL